MQINENYIVQEINDKVLASQKAFMRKVYGWMSSGLLITTLVSFYVFSTGFLGNFLNSTTLIILFVAQFGAVIALSGWAMKMSTPVAAALFVVYSALTGLTLSSIFYIYTIGSIINVFLTAAITFGALSFWGFITKRDLTAWGSFFFIGLIGIIVASLVNLFLASSALDFVISVIGVLVFAGLTAYDTQKIKEMHLVRMSGGSVEANTAIVGALVLYLDFINLFLMLLRLFGDRR